MMMKRSTRILLPLLLLSGLAATAAAAPRIVLSVERLDLGTMNQNEMAERTVTVSNTGDRELVLNELHSSCPCTVPELASDRIAPGASTVLTIRLHSRTFQGAIAKEVLFYTNDPARPEVEIQLRAMIHTPLRIEPENRTLDFGKVSPGESAILKAELFAEGVSGLKLAALEYDRDMFTVQFARGADSPAHQIVRVGIISGSVTGQFRKILRIETNVDGYETLDLELTGSLGAELFSDPALVNFRFVNPGQELRQQIKVASSSAGGGFRVTGVEIDLPGLEASVTDQGEDGEATILLAGKPLDKSDPIATANRGRFKGKLRIFTDVPGQPELLVDVVYLIRM